MNPTGDHMTVLLLYLSHHVAPLDALDRLTVPAARLGDVLRVLHAEPAVDEALILSTCNRLEVYLSSQRPATEVAETVISRLAAEAGVSPEEAGRHMRLLTGAASVEHLFSVACGLDSMAVGEGQIVAQIRDAARAAAEAGTTGGVLTDLVATALRVSKRARTETDISAAGISLVRVGLDLARLHGTAGPPRHGVVVGTGSVGNLAAHLLRGDAGRLSIVGRNEAGAARVAEAVGGRALPVSQLTDALSDADLLVAATGAVDQVIDTVTLNRAGRDPELPLVVLDLGMPRNVDPAVRDLPRVTLLDIATLGRHLAGAPVSRDIDRVREIVAAEVAAYLDLQRSAPAVPVIGALRLHLAELVEAELLRLQDRLPGLSDQQRAETATTVHRIARKFLHRPTVRAKQLSAEPGGAVYLDALLELFELSISEAKACPR
jgi:glutamyl-tRNA reductase